MVSGMSLDLNDIPKQKKIPHEIKMNKVETQAAKAQIQQLIAKAAIRPCSLNPKSDFLSNIFLRPKPDGSYRMILNLKKFNKYLEYSHFKMETLQNILDLVTPHCYMCVLDMTDAYLTVGINKCYFRFLKFRFMGKTYMYICLPFGISSAPRKFTKLLKPIIAYLRLHGTVIVIYIDDLWITAQTFAECLNSMYRTATTLTKVGFLLNKKKSKPVPAQEVITLGYTINSVSMTVSLPTHKEKDILKHCANLLSAPKPPIRQVARTLGKIISCFPVLPIGRAHYRFLEHDKLTALQQHHNNYDKTCLLSTNARKELAWWIKNIPRAAAPIDRGPATRILFCDASKLKWGTYFPPFTTNGYFDELEAAESINTKELLAIWYSILSFLPHIAGHHILIHSDNTTAISYVKKAGGMENPLRDHIARLIWNLASDHKFWISIAHIPGIENTESDRESRTHNPHIEWELPQPAFTKITKHFGKPDIDLFASRINAKLEKFVSWLPDPHCLQVDAFSLNWSNNYFYIFPPFILLSRVLAKIQRDKTTAIIIFPNWPTQHWFPRLTSLLLDFPRKIPQKYKLFLPWDPSRTHTVPKLQLLAAKISGDTTKTWAFHRALLPSYPEVYEIALKHNTTKANNCGMISPKNGKLIPILPL